ncbi:L-rhamnose mutarotase [Tunturiibacter lichenicola]|uniref:L-rhamnose mutarotase n=1 Tax=Tunturiibacter lichenicola TaxID=2051959 RepID=UPI003D9B7F15
MKDNKAAIAEYKRYHIKIWPEVKQSLLDSGIVAMEIYLLGTRNFMIMDVDDAFSPSAKVAADAVNVKVPRVGGDNAAVSAAAAQSSP